MLEDKIHATFGDDEPTGFGTGWWSGVLSAFFGILALGAVVCLHFPQLKICMAHGADPWWGVAIRLMIKYRNLHLMTSAYSPRYFPPELVHFMNTRGQEKILFASDHPVLSTERCIKEAHELDLRPGVLDKFLYGNAERLFFSPRKPRH